MYDLCVIGGGAAGISCAIAAGRCGKKVLLLEKNNKLGKKLYATGNGKCNLTNSDFQIEKHFNSNDKDYVRFIETALDNAYNTKEPMEQIIDLMESIGINTTNNNNYIYPSSAQASSVVWAMIDELKQCNVEILLNSKVLSITGKYPHFEIKCENEAFKALNVVLSNGGQAYKSLGGTTWGYTLAKNFGHSIVDIRPSLCGLCVEEDLSDIAGVRADATIHLKDNAGNTITTSQGELQLTKQGLSGICIFEISSKAGELIYNNISSKIQISFLDNKAFQTLLNIIDGKKYGERTVIGLLNGFVNDKLAAYVCKLHNIDGKSKAKDLSSKELLKLTTTLNNMIFNVVSLYDMEQAQVTAGGVNIKEVNSNNMESKIVKGLYIVGELLDIDGICGGYNLTFAMLSGYKAGKSIYDKN